MNWLLAYFIAMMVLWMPFSVMRTRSAADAYGNKVADSLGCIEGMTTGVLLALIWPLTLVFLTVRFFAQKGLDQ